MLLPLESYSSLISNSQDIPEQTDWTFEMIKRHSGNIFGFKQKIIAKRFHVLDNNEIEELLTHMYYFWCIIELGWLKVLHKNHYLNYNTCRN